MVAASQDRGHRGDDTAGRGGQAKRLRDIRHADDAFYARTVDEASDQRVRDQRQVAGANATLPTPKEGLVD